MDKILSFLIFALISNHAVAEGTEVSLFSGYRSGGDLENAETGNKASFDETNSYGIIIGSDYGPEHVMEFLYSFQNTKLSNSTTINNTNALDVDIEYFQIGGSQIWASEKKDNFFGATLGAIHMNPNSAGLSSKSRFAMTMGGGTVFKFTKNIGLRLEVRGYFAALGSSESFCAGSQCVVVGSGFMKQFDVNAGLRIRF